jgi:hypothetical protein
MRPELIEELRIIANRLDDVGEPRFASIVDEMAITVLAQAEDNQDAGLGLLGGGGETGAVDDTEILVRSQDVPQPLAEDRMIIHNHYFDSVCHT